MHCAAKSEQDRKDVARDLTSYMLHKYYGENDVEAVVELFADPFTWLGAGEHEHGTGAANVTYIFRQFAGFVPKCTLSEEEYEVSRLSKDAYLCAGRVWISTDPSTEVYLRMHQRITTAFLFSGDEVHCCHIHISNPYTEMTADDIGFPSQMARQSREYLQAQIDEQKRLLAEQAEKLIRLSFSDALTGLANRTKFNLDVNKLAEEPNEPLGIAYFDLNSLKETNDRCGHAGGDELLVRAAGHISRVFPGCCYRIGGDEFVVIDRAAEEQTFRTMAEHLRATMEADDVSCSVGVSWQPAERMNFREQFFEADKQMYAQKELYYRSREIARRKKR